MKADEAIEDVLTYMELSERGDWHKKSKYHDLPLSYFDGAFIVHPEVNDSGSWMFLENVPPTLFTQRIDIRFIVPNRSWGRYAVHRLKKVDPSTVRGRISRFAPHIFEKSVGLINDEGKYRTARTIVGWTGTRWMNLAGPEMYPCEEGLGHLKVSTSLLLSKYLDWHAKIGFVGGLSVTFSTDPTGARELFKLRDIPAGKCRREALKNWVRAHWRKKRSNPDEASQVREHLRGQSKFTWNGLRVEIIPATAEIEEKLNPEIKALDADQLERLLPGSTRLVPDEAQEVSRC